MRYPRVATAALLAGAALALTGCGLTADGPAASVSPGDTLIGAVGTEDDADAYEISLSDEAGDPVVSAPAGDYTLHIVDRSPIHNFRFFREDGAFNVSTEVEEVTEETIEITLEPGAHGYVCEPHAGQMNGSLEVTD